MPLDVEPPRQIELECPDNTIGRLAARLLKLEDSKCAEADLLLTALVVAPDS